MVLIFWLIAGALIGCLLTLSPGHDPDHALFAKLTAGLSGMLIVAALLGRADTALLPSGPFSLVALLAGTVCFLLIDRGRHRSDHY